MLMRKSASRKPSISMGIRRIHVIVSAATTWPMVTQPSNTPHAPRPSMTTCAAAGNICIVAHIQESSFARRTS